MENLDVRCGIQWAGHLGSFAIWPLCALVQSSVPPPPLELGRVGGVAETGCSDRVDAWWPPECLIVTSTRMSGGLHDCG